MIRRNHLVQNRGKQGRLMPRLPRNVCHNDLAESEADLLNVESSEQAFVKPSSHTACFADDDKALRPFAKHGSARPAQRFITWVP
jgi:hypothetical protein